MVLFLPHAVEDEEDEEEPEEMSHAMAEEEFNYRDFVLR